jgi:16S rRNA (cytosine967-C5)-methyltransferase
VASALRGGRSLVVTADGTRPAWSPGTFDRVLVDAPCTGLGALRRRPEARWRRKPDDAERLHPLQVRLLSEAVRATRPGGLVAYVTCSPHPRETLDVVAAVRSGKPTVTTVPPPELLARIPALESATHVQLWPHRHGTDAMFISLLRRDPDDQ